MFCEALETRRLFAVTLRPPVPPQASGDPGTQPPECAKVTQDGKGGVSITHDDRHGTYGGGNHGTYGAGGGNQGTYGSGGNQGTYGAIGGHQGTYGSGGGNHGTYGSGGNHGTYGALGGGSHNEECPLEITVIEDHGKLVVTEISTGATWDVTGATAIKIVGSALGDQLFYTGNTLGAQITGDAGVDTITVADAGSGSSTIDSGAGDDSIVLLVSHNTHANGGDGNDTIYVNSGVGVYNTSAAVSYIDGGKGNDVIVTYFGKSYIEGGAGQDTVLDAGGAATTNINSHVESVQ